MKTACVLVPSSRHTTPDHPEVPGRFSQLGDWQAKPYASALQWLDVQPARIEEITAVHSTRMVHALAEECSRGPGIIDSAPTYVTRDSFADALQAAGGTLECSRAVLEERAGNAFAIVRPPGHHAEPGRPMGFCLFNNIAIAVEDALARGTQKALIFDFDVHHGNGTQAAFWNDGRVAYFSTHQEYIYPGSGRIEEAPHARGRIVNLPLPPRAGNTAFEAIAQKVLAPLVRRFAPEMIFVSSGFDAHWKDPLALLGVSTAGFFSIARQLVALAEEQCRGRIVFVLEGGYSAEVVAASVDAVLAALTSKEYPGRASSPASAAFADDPSPYPEPEVGDRIEALLDWHGIK